MRDTWQLQEAKNRFSEVVNKAVSGGPQVITKHGTETVVVISYEKYQRLKQSGTSLSEFFRSSPLAGVDLDVTRDKTTPRLVDL